jgi:Short C-terminal domain
MYISCELGGTMSKWRDKSEARLQSLLTSDEEVIRTGDGMVGLKEAFFVLTNKRIFIFRLGTTVLSEPKMAEVELEHIRSAYCEPGLMTKGPTLVIESRTGTFSVTLTKMARKDSGAWPKWILEAQKRMTQLNTSARTSPPSTNGAERDPGAKLRKLQELREAGLLSQAEYETKRSEVIDSI